MNKKTRRVHVLRLLRIHILIKDLFKLQHIGNQKYNMVMKLRSTMMTLLSFQTFTWSTFFRQRFIQWMRFRQFLHSGTQSLKLWLHVRRTNHLSTVHVFKP